MESRIKLLKSLSRMCQATTCIRCPIRHFKAEGSMQPCINILGKHPEEIINTIERWAKTHPEKTILDDVKEKYPNITLADDGVPDMCPKALGYIKDQDCTNANCTECWKQPINK